MKTKLIADRFHVRPAWTRRVKPRRREMGETTPRPMGEATVVKIDAIRLAEFVRQPPDATRKEQRVRPRELIEATGVRLVFLPPYGPDLNPIERIFVKIKPLRRSLACRTRETLWAARPSVLDPVRPDDAANGYKHYGYTLRLD